MLTKRVPFLESGMLQVRVNAMRARMANVHTFHKSRPQVLLVIGRRIQRVDHSVVLDVKMVFVLQPKLQARMRQPCCHKEGSFKRQWLIGVNNALVTDGVGDCSNPRRDLQQALYTPQAKSHALSCQPMEKLLA